jgi:hypothetical protein
MHTSSSPSLQVSTRSSILIMLSQPDPTSITTTFLFLRPLKSERPDILNNDSPAAQTFNVALRGVASRDGYRSQWFGWQHSPSSTPDSRTCPDRLIWAISTHTCPSSCNALMTEADCLFSDWQDTPPAQVVVFPHELEKVLGDLALYFEVPDVPPCSHDIAAEVGKSLILAVQWRQGDAQKILDRTNRTLEVCVRKQLAPQVDAVSQEDDVAAASNPDLVAVGRVAAPQIEAEDWKLAEVVVLSLSQEAPVEEQVFSRVHDRAGAAIRVSLTRTRWCTRLRGDLHDAIKARKVD